MPDLEEGRPRQAVLICNAKSRRGREWYPAVHQRLVDEGFELMISKDVRQPARVKELVRQAVDSKVPLVIVGGGDGTMSGCAGVFKGSESIMGVLPLGTGNAFARDLGIPSEVEGACKVLLEGTPRAIDLGMACDRHFVNVATVGLTTLIAEELRDEEKKKFGRFVYVFAAARALAKIRPFRATLRKPDSDEVFETMQIVFGSGRFHAGPFPVTPDAEITDRYLHGYALRASSKGALLKMALRLWGAKHVELPEVETFKLKRATLETSPRERVVIDGEVAGHTPTELAIDPGAIRVMTAQDFPGAHSIESDVRADAGVMT